MVGVPTPDVNLRRRVSMLETELEELKTSMQKMRRQSSQRNNSRDVFVAITAEYSSYPSDPANVFGLIFQTISFTRSEGNQTPTYTAHSASVQDFGLSLIGYIPEDTYVIVKRQRNGQYIIVASLGATKMLCRFTLNSALATSDASKAATIQTQLGPGKDHTSTSITVNNFLTHTAGTYLFEGDSGDAGLAYYIFGTTWQIIQMECP